MKPYKEIYWMEQLPVFQNRMFHSEKEAKDCVKGDILLVQDSETDLIFNQAFKSELMQYDTDYQNEQAVSAVFRQHLENVSEVIQKRQTIFLMGNICMLLPIFPQSENLHRTKKTGLNFRIIFLTR